MSNWAYTILFYWLVIFALYVSCKYKVRCYFVIRRDNKQGHKIFVTCAATSKFSLALLGYGHFKTLKLYVQRRRQRYMGEQTEGWDGIVRGLLLEQTELDLQLAVHLQLRNRRTHVRIYRITVIHTLESLCIDPQIGKIPTVEEIFVVNGGIGVAQSVHGNVRALQSRKTTISVIYHLLSGKAHCHMRPISSTNHIELIVVSKLSSLLRLLYGVRSIRRCLQLQPLKALTKMIYRTSKNR